MGENFDDIKAIRELLAMMDIEEIDYWLRGALSSGRKRLAEILNEELKEREIKAGESG